MKTIKVRKDKKTGDCYLKLDDFKDLIDITKVGQFSLERVEDGSGDGTCVKCLILKFYDKDGNIIQAGK